MKTEKKICREQAGRPTNQPNARMPQECQIDFGMLSPAGNPGAADCQLVAGTVGPRWAAGSAKCSQTDNTAIDWGQIYR